MTGLPNEENAIQPLRRQSANLGVLGYGNVGKGVVKILLDPEGRDPSLARINLVRLGVRDIKRPRPNVSPEILTDNLESIVNHPDIDIIIEVMGGIEPARTLIIQAIENGKHIITANKTLIANHGIEIFALAAKKGVSVKFEPAVGGGIPIIEVLNSGMGANRLEGITGIVNGTCNYIFTRMAELGLSYDKALEEATELGYAEANPDADVSGRDSAEKLAILVKEGFGLNVDPQVLTDSGFVKGITSISPRDIQCAKELDYTIKLLATSAIQRDDTLLFAVRPHFVSNRHPLATVNNNLNAIYIKGDKVGELLLSGKGAGGDETASAVVADVINTIKSISSGVAAISAPSPAESTEFVTLSSEIKSKFYLRILTGDIPIAFGGIMWLLGKVNIVPEYVQQHITPDGLLEIVMITQPVSSQMLKDGLRSIRALPHCKEVANSLPLLEVS
jgi:homoserine dehydrogenase